MGRKGTFKVGDSAWCAASGLRRLGAKLLADAAPWVEGRLLRHPERAGSLMGAEWVVEFAAAPSQTFTLKKQQLRRVCGSIAI